MHRLHLISYRKPFFDVKDSSFPSDKNCVHKHTQKKTHNYKTYTFFTPLKV